MDFKYVLDHLQTIVYSSIIGITEGELESGSIAHEDGTVEKVEKTYFGNGHHLSQRIASDVEISVMGRHLYKGDLDGDGWDLHCCLMCPILYEMTKSKEYGSFTGDPYNISLRMTYKIREEIKRLLKNE